MQNENILQSMNMTQDTNKKDGNTNFKSKRSLSVSHEANATHQSVNQLLPQIKLSVDQSNLKLTHRQMKVATLIR